MTIIEALKEFYKNSVEDINKLNDADSVLEVLRAKYGDYKGSNVAEFIQELIINGVSPGSGGGGGDLVYPTFEIDGQIYTITCDKTYEECLAMCEDSGIAVGSWFCGIEVALEDGDREYLGVMSEDEGFITITIVQENIVFYYYEDGTVTFDAPELDTY